MSPPASPGAIRNEWPVPAQFALALAAIMAALPGGRIVLMRGLDGILFNYFNNVAAPDAVFFLNGWIHLLPALMAYGARHLPATAQGTAYVVFAVLAAAIMLREYYRLLRLWLTARETVVFTLVALLYLQFSVPVLAQLVWSVWTIALAVFCHVLRKNLAGERYTALGLAAAIAGGLSNPTAAVLIPLLGYFAWTAPDKMLRPQNATIAIALAAFFLATLLLKPDDARYLSSNLLVSSARVMWHQLVDASRYSLVPLVAAAALLWRCWRAIGAPHDPRQKAVLALGYTGFASLALYFLTARSEISSGLPPRYTIFLVMCGIAVLAIDGFPRLNDPQRRAVLVSAAAAALVCEIAIVGTRYAGAFVRTREQFAFTADATAFREGCQPGEALLQRATPPRATRSYPFVLCKPVALDMPDTASLVATRDDYGNTYLQGLRARIWRTQETAAIELFVPRR